MTHNRAIIFKLYTDGGSRGNPGEAAIGCVLTDNNNKIIETISTSIGITTNNIAEYSAIVAGLDLAIKNNVENLECYLDSELVVRQLNGIYKVRDKKMKQYFLMVQDKIQHFSTLHFIHIVRADNKVADKLVNDALDD